MRDNSKYRAQVTEVINRQKLTALALEKGYNSFLPVYDGGIDFILYREDGAGGPADLRKIQLKGRWYIDKKYEGRDIWIAFPDGDQWYIAPHDTLVEIGDDAGFTKTASWKEGGAYSCGKLSAKLSKAMEPWLF
ncbi:MAG: hypothetical protein AAGE37_10745 [Pseudomonadota bacterium]